MQAPTLDDTAPAGLAAMLRIHLTYLWRHGRLPDLTDPQRFTELVQLSKLRDRDPRMAAMADKVAVKALVADRLGHDWVIPTLWSGPALPPRQDWGQSFVVKSRHGCRQNVFVAGPGADWQAIGRTASRWTRKAYGGWLDEWLYTAIPRGLLIEPFVGADATLPVDYKIYVFGGRATHVQVHTDRGTDHRWSVYDTDWSPVSTRPPVPRPSALGAMIGAAEELSRGFDFARVDFYQPADQPLFGEICFYPGSGLDRFDPVGLDIELGRLWRAVDPAILRSPPPAPARTGRPATVSN